MASTQLNLYNKALRMVGERKLGSLTEERKPRRLLDDVWAQGGVDFCLEQAQWYFAMRTVMMDYDPAVEPSFGYRRAFNKPDDWIITSAVCTDEYFKVPLTEYADEAEFWYCEQDIVYIKYVSNDVDYGYNLNKWPETFEEYVAAYFASEIVLGINNDIKKYEGLLRILDRKKLDAKSKSAMTGPTQFPAPGSWTGSRTDRFRRSRGNRNQLLG